MLKGYSMILTASFYDINHAEVINKKSLFPEFQLILKFRLQVMLHINFQKREFMPKMSLISKGNDSC